MYVKRKQEAFVVLLVGAALCLLFSARACGQSCVTNAQVSLTGVMRVSNGLPVSNAAITFTPSHAGFIAGCGVNLPISSECATSVDGSTVLLPNPLSAPMLTTSGGGTLPSGVYYVVIQWVDALGHVTLPSPEARATLSATGSLVVNPPGGMPSTAVGMQVFIGTSSGGETLQGSTTGSAAFVQSTALTTGAAPASSNNSVCVQTANDAIWPVGTGYIVTMTDPNGNAEPGFPMQWQLLGPGTSYNLANGWPYYNGVVTYPVPILSQPQNHGQQTISGNLSLGGYNLLNAGKVGIGTSTPGWPLDVENGLANFEDGFILGGTPPSGTECAGSTDGISIDVYLPCITSLPTIYYQTIDLNGTAQTQRLAANLSQRFTTTDSASPSRTNIDLNGSGNGNIVATFSSSPSTSTALVQLDGAGNLEPTGSNACSSFSSTSSAGCTITADGRWMEWVIGPDFPAAGPRGAQSQTWPITFPNHLYAVNVSVLLDNAVTTNAQQYGFYIEPVGTSVSGCTDTTGLAAVCLYGDVGPDGLGDSTHKPYIIAIGN